jgi:hypothetical protein
MNHQQRILELRREIERLENELHQEQNAYIVDALAKDIRFDEFGGYRFRIKRKPASLELKEDDVPGRFFKLSIDRGAVRQYLRHNGQQSWGALRDEGFMLTIQPKGN